MRGATICRPVAAAGVGYPSLRPTRLRLEPAPPGTGIIFNRRWPARVENAGVAGSSVCLGRGRLRVRLVEHLLAACSGLGVTDLFVDVEGREVPLFDGSSLPFVRLLRRAGLGRQGRLRPLVIEAPVVVRGSGGWLAAFPARGFRVDCFFTAPGIGPQFVAAGLGPGVFVKEVAGARTFGRPVMPVEELGRRLGLRFRLRRLDGLVLPERPRFRAEPARHKLLDLVGDLSLLGRPLRARLFCFRPGHRLNLSFVRRLVKEGRVCGD